MKKLLLTALAFSFCLLSCSKSDTDSAANVAPADGAVSFSSTIETRVTGTSFDDGDPVSISSYDASGVVDALVSYKWDESSSKFVATADAIEKLEETSLAYAAVYPATSTSSHTIVADQNTGDGFELSDLLIANEDATDDNSVTLNFKHTLSKVIVNVEVDDKRQIGTDDIVGVPTLTGQPTTVAVDLAAGVVSSPTGSESITPMTVDDSDQNDSSYAAIIIPASYEQAASFGTLSIVGEDNLEWTLDKAVTFEAGYSYVYTWSVEIADDAPAKSTVTLTGIIDSWDQENGLEVPSPGAADDVEIDQEAMTIYVGDTITLSATVSPSNALDKSVTWSSNNACVEVLDASTGEIEAKSTGSAIITVTANDTTNGTLEDTIEITVNAAEVTSVTITEGESLTVDYGSTTTLSATVNTNGVIDNMAVTWSDDASGYASVDASGVVTAVSAGSTVVTATSSANGEKKAQITITVSDPVPALLTKPLTALVLDGDGAHYGSQSPAQTVDGTNGLLDAGQSSSASNQNGYQSSSTGKGASITIDLGKEYTLTEFKFWQRRCNRIYASGNPRRFRLYGATDAATDGETLKSEYQKTRANNLWDNSAELVPTEDSFVTYSGGDLSSVLIADYESMLAKDNYGVGWIELISHEDGVLAIPANSGASYGTSSLNSNQTCWDAAAAGHAYSITETTAVRYIRFQFVDTFETGAGSAQWLDVGEFDITGY